jgi:hypothetical protein
MLLRRRDEQCPGIAGVDLSSLSMLKENLRAANKEVPEFTSNPIQIQLMQGVLEENDDMRLAHSSLSTTLPPSRAFPPLPSSLKALLVFHGSSAASSMKTRLPAVAQFPGLTGMSRLL